ncbi:MAG: citrate/2-methylcitrate synthase [Candidatus Levybacteria bacterium]|nr:citrate/2-methylcitrate synthase [Candidatus Levybacteria bacterium]
MNIQELRVLEPKIVSIGYHPGIIQSVLDYDFLIGRSTPSIVGLVASGRRYARFFFGRRELLIPVFASLSKIPKKTKDQANMLLNVSSGRRTLLSTIEAIDFFPNLKIGTIFAEGVPEKHAIDLFEYAKDKNVTLIGPASVGLVIPGVVKLGAIGGISQKQIVSSGILSGGGVCVLSASGGMVNEIINVVNATHNKVSFSLSFGGDRFPLLEPVDALMAAQSDEQTQAIVYYGELGGEDEYKLAKLIEIGHITKPVICYVAGTISDLFETPPQFGHAKAMAETKVEGAKEKRQALSLAGAKVPESFSSFVGMIQNLPEFGFTHASGTIENMDDRKHALISSSISKDVDGDIKILGEDLLPFAKDNSFAKIAASLFLGHKINSPDTEELVDFILKVSVDHGPYVSGALNTIVSARAGKDLVSSLATGLLTIGPRFGGALNEAARNWLTGVSDGKSAHDFVEEYASKKIYIQGIGHKKYRIDMPDPRVVELKTYSERLEKKRFINFALDVERITTEKKGNLILNVDGAIAALLLDFLSEKEGYSDEQLNELVTQEFFNALFVLSRSVGFIAHFLDQKRLDEGLLRLAESDVADASQ